MSERIRRCGDECGHWDSCQCFCGFDFEDAQDGDLCRYGLESDDYEDELLGEEDDSL